MPQNTANVDIPLNDDLWKKKDKWSRIEKLLLHDEDALKDAPFCQKLPDESVAAYQERQDYFASNFINKSQDLVSAPGEALFKNGYKLDVPKTSMLYSFSENCTLANDAVPFPRYLRDYIALGLRSYGTTFTVMDKPAVSAKSRADERKAGRPYLINIRPLDVVNYSFTAGELDWFAYRRKQPGAWADPTIPQPLAEEIVCVWTRDEYFTVRADGSVPGTSIIEHGWGFVPVIVQASFLAIPEDVLGQWAFDQSSNMIITANNLNHIAVFELFKHGNSLLLMHEQSVMGSNMTVDKAGNTKLKKQAKGRVLQWAGEQEPKYLVKELAVKECRELAEAYFAAAIDNERDLSSVAKKGTTGEAVQESGFAKMIDREPLEGNLDALADDLELFSAKVYGMAARMLNVKNDALLTFDRDFDLRSYKQKLEELKEAIANKMGEVTPTGMTETWKGLVPEITTDPDTTATINKELEANVPAVFGREAAVREEAFGAEDGLQAKLKAAILAKNPQEVARIQAEIDAAKKAQTEEGGEQ